MGFGILFLGYFIAFLMSFHKFGFACQILGYYLIFIALQKLSEYKRILTRAILPLLFMTLCSLFHGANVLLETFGAETFPPMLSAFADIIWTASNFIFHLFLLQGIAKLGEETALVGIVSQARWNTVFTTFYLLINIIVNLLYAISLSLNQTPDSFLEKILSILAPLTALISIIYPIILLFLLFSCYKNICAPEDLDMAPKPSRFAFINKSREKSAEQDRKMEAWLEDQKDKQNRNKK